MKRSGRWRPNGKFVYVTDELGSTVPAFTYDIGVRKSVSRSSARLKPRSFRMSGVSARTVTHRLAEALTVFGTHGFPAFTDALAQVGAPSRLCPCTEEVTFHRAGDVAHL